MILQEHLEKEDEVLVSLAGLKQVRLSAHTRMESSAMFTKCFEQNVFSVAARQIKDILKGALRFNQSQLEAEENEEITIADDHYTSTAAAAETALGAVPYQQQQGGGGGSGRSQDSNLDSGMSTEEKDEEEEEEEEQAVTPPEQQVD